MTMTPRERVLAVINHEEPDRVPIIIGTSNATGIRMGAYRRLKQQLNIHAPDEYLYDWPELGTAILDEQTCQTLCSDARGVLDRFPQENYRQNESRDPHLPHVSDWGVTHTEIAPDVWFPTSHPMAQAATLKEIEDYPWPNMDDPTRVAHVRVQARKLREENQYAIIGTPWLLFPFERAIAMQGMDVFLLNMAENPEFARALLLKIAELCKRLMGHFLDELGDNVDIIKIGDDLGTQKSLMISPSMYRQFLKDIHADFVAFIRQRSNAKIFFHTDGDVFDLIPDLIEIGVNILNPIQTSAGRMSNLAELKKRFGNALTFCGAIDTQNILPFGTPAQVRDEVKRVINILGPGGGYLLASVHTIIDDVPPENILAMVEAVKAYGAYPLRP